MKQTFDIVVFGKRITVKYQHPKHEDFTDADAATDGKTINVNRDLSPHARWHAIIHELWHIAFPTKEEGTVCSESTIFAEALWPSVDIILEELE